MKALLIVFGGVLVAACEDSPNHIPEAAGFVVQDQSSSSTGNKIKDIEK